MTKEGLKHNFLKSVMDLRNKDLIEQDSLLDVFENVIEPYISELEKENAELKSELTKKADTNHSLIEQMADLESENAELKEKLEHRNCVDCSNHHSNIKLIKAKEHIRTLISCLIDWVQEGDKDYCYIADAEQFLKENGGKK